MRLAALVCAALCSIVTAAHGQTYPTKTVRVLVGFAPGGSTDLTARLFAQELNKLWGTPVVVDNRPGASGVIAAELAAKAAPDGYTWLVSPQTSMVLAPLILKKVPYDPIRDFAPSAVIGSTPQLPVIHPSLPPRSFREFASFVKANAKTLSFASGGVGSTPHMAGELLNLSLKVHVTHVPYKGENPGVVDLLGGQVPYMFSNFLSSFHTYRRASCERWRSRAQSARRSRRNFLQSPNPAFPVSIPQPGADSTCRAQPRASLSNACTATYRRSRTRRISRSACSSRASTRAAPIRRRSSQRFSNPNSCAGEKWWTSRV